jgi:NAD+ synthase
MNADKVSKHIINWLLNYAQKAKVNGFVIGISGGIDSAVTSTLCALTGLPTLCLEMPIHQAESQVNRGKEHINELKRKFSNVDSSKVNLTLIFESFKNLFPTIATDNVELPLANSRARIRMTTLYYFAGVHNYLVVGTGNKIEDFGVGFYTKYGDGGVDISPIADLLKSEVFDLGRFLNVPESILNAKPTDGLFGDNRSDEDQLGASYDELEWAMKHTELETKNHQFTEREKEVFEIYTRLNKANQHKMIPIPVCVIPEEFKN